MKKSYSNWDNEVFQRDCFYLHAVHDVYSDSAGTVAEADACFLLTGGSTILWDIFCSSTTPSSVDFPPSDASCYRSSSERFSSPEWTTSCWCADSNFSITVITNAYWQWLTRKSSGWGIGLVTQWSRVRAPAAALSSNNLGQDAHTHVTLSPFTKQYNSVLADWAVTLFGWKSNCRPGRNGSLPPDGWLSHLWAECLYTGISCGPNAR